MTKILPLIDLILAHGWMPEYMQLQSDHDKTFAKLTTQISKFSFLSLEELDKGFVDIIKGYGEYQAMYDESSDLESNTLLSAFESSYSKTKTASEECHLIFKHELGHSYAEKFYSAAVDADTRHCLLWLKEQERLLKSDDDMKQVVRETLNVITAYCRMTHAPSDTNSSIFGFVLRKITALYFEIVCTYLKEHENWCEYIETYYSDQLPTTFLEFTSIYWEDIPTEEEENAWNEFLHVERKPTITEKPKTMVPTGAEAKENEIISKYDHFVEVVETYKFFDCPSVACLTKEQRGKLILKIVNRSDKYGAYAVAMLCELEYDTWMKNNFAKNNPYNKKGITKNVIFKHWADALCLKNERYIAGNYNIIKNPNSKEDRTVYKASEFTLTVHQDYEAIKGK